MPLPPSTSAGIRVCKPGMEGLGLNFTLGACKWDELLATKVYLTLPQLVTKVYLTLIPTTGD